MVKIYNRSGQRVVRTTHTGGWGWTVTDDTILMYTGDDRELLFTIKDNDRIDMEMSNLDDAQFVINYPDGDIIKTVGFGITLVGDMILVHIPSGDTKNLGNLDLDFELNVILNARRHTASRGDFILTESLVVEETPVIEEDLYEDYV